MSLLQIPEVLSEEVHAWIERERGQRPGVSHAMLVHVVARALGVTERQFYRYMSGETPLPLEKTVAVCRTLGSWRLLQVVNQDGGLIAEPKPDVGKITGFDLVMEQSHNFREFSELAGAFADAMDRPVSELELKRIEKEGVEAIQQIQRLICCYREMAVRHAGAAR